LQGSAALREALCLAAQSLTELPEIIGAAKEPAAGAAMAPHTHAALLA
jgi:hypothetical protein